MTVLTQEDPIMETKKTLAESGSPVVAAVKFLPLAIFAALVIVAKLDLLLAAPIATFSALGIYMILYRARFDAAFEHCLHAVREIVVVFFILMFAYGVAECFMATGVGAALINLALELGVTARTVAPVALIVTGLLSVATGTSWGTFAACAPILLWLCHLVGGNILLTVCAVAGGSCFGDNIGMISDVTVLSCGLQDVKIVDRLKHQLGWVLGTMALGLVVLLIASAALPNTTAEAADAIASIPPEAREALAIERPSALSLLEQVEQGVPYYMILPLVVVIVLAFSGMHTMVCLSAGMLSSLALGWMAGTTNLTHWLNDLLLVGFGDAGSWVIVMMAWVAAFGGLMNAMSAFEPLSRLMVKGSKNIHHLMGWCGVMCLAGNAALADEAAQVATLSPVLRDIVDKNVEATPEQNYTLRLRLATFTSAMGIYGSQLIPWHCFPVFFAGIASAVYPLMEFTPMDMISRNYMGMIVVFSALILTFTGLDRYIPGFKLPDVKLKKK